MENLKLSTLQSCASFFQGAILLNLQYWQSWIEPKTAYVAALERERDSLVRERIWMNWKISSLSIAEMNHTTS
jgi:hypothetical protein